MRGEPSAIKSEYIEKSDSTRRTSRYRGLKRMVNEDNMSYMESPEKIIIKESTKDIFYSVEKGYENRLDLISYKFYNTPFLWWAIATMNHIDNPMVIEAGIVLRIPAISSIYGSGGVLSLGREED